MVQFHTCTAYRRCFCPNALASTSSKMNARHVMTRHIVWLSGKRITSSGLDAIFEDSISTSKLADHYSSSWKERQSAKWGIGCVTNDGSQPCADDPTQSTLTKRNYYVRAVNSRETNGIIIAFPSPGRLFTKIELVRWYETGCQVHTPLVERRTHQYSVTVICISCVLWGHQSNFASESLGGHSGEG